MGRSSRGPSHHQSNDPGWEFVFPTLMTSPASAELWDVVSGVTFSSGVTRSYILYPYAKRPVGKIVVSILEG